MTRRKIKPQRHAVRAIIVGSLFMLWLLMVGVRAGYLQIYKGNWLSDKAAGQYSREQSLQGKRGAIYDRNHQAMAVSLETTSIAAYPANFTDQDVNQAAQQLARALDLKAGDVRTALTAERSFIWLKRQASPKQVSAVKALQFKGVGYVAEHARYYPNTTVAAQVLGFVGIDGRGLEGLEFYYDARLNGSTRKITLHKDALGRGFKADQQLVLDDAALAQPTETGHNLTLTIDRHIQYIAEQALAETVSAYQARSGMVIVMDPHSGALLALANYPFFNPNDYGKFHRNTWRNRAITDTFEPGSTMKIFSAAAALESRIVTPSTIFFCENGAYTVGGHRIHDTKPYSWLSVQQIVKYSSNIGTVKMAQQLGRQELYEQLKAFGFGDPTRIDCPGEEPGILAPYKRWTTVDTGAIAFGQGIAVTALQMASAAAALANDGWLMQPHLVQAITDADGQPVYTATPAALRRVVSAETAAQVRRIMRSVITEGGTGVQAEIEGYAVCGKTGTAQKPTRDGRYSDDEYIASFIGLVPTERPELVILVVVDEPKGTNYGGVVAAPTFRRIAKEAMGYLNIAPDENWQRWQVSGEHRTSG